MSQRPFAYPDRYATKLSMVGPVTLGRARRLTWALWVALLLGLGVAGEARAQRKVIRLEAIKVEGRIQKPQAFYILQRSNLNFEGLDLKQTFVPKIIKSIDEKPF